MNDQVAKIKAMTWQGNEIGKLRKRIAELEAGLETLRMSALNALSIMPSGREKADLRDAYDHATEILEVCDK